MTPTVLLTISDDPGAGVLAQQLLRGGCRVAVTGPDVGALLDAVRGYGAGRATVLVGDVADPADTARVRAAAEASLGRIDVVIPGDVVIPADVADRTGRLATVHRLPTRTAADRAASRGVHDAVA